MHLSDNASRLLVVLLSHARPDGTIALPALPELQEQMGGLAKAPLISCLRRLQERQLITF